MDKLKVCIVSNLADKTFLTISSAYDIELYKDFKDFIEDVNARPFYADILVVTSSSLPFTNEAMSLFIKTLKAPFLKVQQSTLYLYDESIAIQQLSDFLKDQDLSIETAFCKSTTLDLYNYIKKSLQYDSKSDELTSTVIRTAVKDFKNSSIFQEEISKDSYSSPDIMQFQKARAPSILGESYPQVVRPVESVVLAGNALTERTALSVLIGQYLSQTGRTLIIEPDFEYHTLSSMIISSGAFCTFIELEDFMHNIKDACKKISNSESNLVVLGTTTLKRSIDYNLIYEFMYDIRELLSIQYIIKTISADAASIHDNCIIVTSADLPNILTQLQALDTTGLNPSCFLSVAMGNVQNLYVTQTEFEQIIKSVFPSSNYKGYAYRIDNLNLAEGGLYELRSILKV